MRCQCDRIEQEHRQKKKLTLSESGSLDWTELAAHPVRYRPSKWYNILCCDIQDLPRYECGRKIFSLTGLSFFTATSLSFRSPLYTVPKPPSPSLLPPSDMGRSSKLLVIFIRSLYKKLEKPNDRHMQKSHYYQLLVNCEKLNFSNMYFNWSQLNVYFYI